MIDGPSQRDDTKAETNVTKHDVTFAMARAVFNGRFAIEWSDDFQDQGEQRFSILGMVEEHVLFVAYTIRGEVIQIISTRRVEPFERRRSIDENRA